LVSLKIILEVEDGRGAYLEFGALNIPTFLWEFSKWRERLCFRRTMLIFAVTNDVEKINMVPQSKVNYDRNYDKGGKAAWVAGFRREGKSDL